MGARVFEVIGFLSAIVGIVAGVVYLWERLASTQPRRLGWSKVRRGVRKIIERLRHDGFIPDLVVGIGRSGAVLGGLIAGNMGNLPLAVLDRKLAWDTKKRDITLSDFSELKIQPGHKKVLFVIGEIYSAQSVVAVLRHLEPLLKDKDYRTAALVKLESAPINVEYVSYVVKRQVCPAWVFSDDYKRT